MRRPGAGLGIGIDWEAIEAASILHYEVEAMSWASGGQARADLWRRHGHRPRLRRGDGARGGRVFMLGPPARDVLEAALATFSAPGKAVSRARATPRSPPTWRWPRGRPPRRWAASTPSWSAPARAVAPRSSTPTRRISSASATTTSARSSSRRATAVPLMLRRRPGRSSRSRRCSASSASASASPIAAQGRRHRHGAGHGARSRAQGHPGQRDLPGLHRDGARPCRSRRRRRTPRRRCARQRLDAPDPARRHARRRSARWRSISPPTIRLHDRPGHRVDGGYSIR